jgi:hypothetical protein
MSDSTIIPPAAPVDRDRRTDPPQKSDHPPPEVVALADFYTKRMSMIDARLRAIEERQIEANAELAAMRELLPEKVAECVAARVSASIQAELRRLDEADHVLLEKLDRLQALVDAGELNGGPNGSHTD